MRGKLHTNPNPRFDDKNMAMGSVCEVTSVRVRFGRGSQVLLREFNGPAVNIA